MSETTPLAQIDQRYSNLAESSCCLSCGGAINFGEPRRGEVCVDLGSGRGNDVLRMAEAVGAEGFVYGIDAAEGMLEKARRGATKLGVKNAAFVRSEFEHIALPDNTADLVISNCSINHAADKRQVWREIYRILKPGGRFAVSDIYSLQDVPAEYRQDPEAVAECWAGAIRKDLYLSILTECGFQEITILEESVPYPKGKIEVCSFTIAARRSEETKCSCK